MISLCQVFREHYNEKHIFDNDNKILLRPSEPKIRIIDQSLR